MMKRNGEMVLVVDGKVVAFTKIHGVVDDVIESYLRDKLIDFAIAHGLDGDVDWSWNFEKITWANEMWKV